MFVGAGGVLKSYRREYREKARSMFLEKQGLRGVGNTKSPRRPLRPGEGKQEMFKGNSRSSKKKKISRPSRENLIGREARGD